MTKIINKTSCVGFKEHNNLAANYNFKIDLYVLLKNKLCYRIVNRIIQENLQKLSKVPLRLEQKSSSYERKKKHFVKAFSVLICMFNLYICNNH